MKTIFDVGNQSPYLFFTDHRAQEANKELRSIVTVRESGQFDQTILYLGKLRHEGPCC